MSLELSQRLQRAGIPAELGMQLGCAKSNSEHGLSGAPYKKTREELDVERKERMRAALASVRGKGTLVAGPDGVLRRGPTVSQKIEEMAAMEQRDAEGNMVPTETVIEDLVKEGLGTLSVKTLATLMEEEDVSETVRASVAKYVMDRILGKPTQREEIKVDSRQVKVNIGITGYMGGVGENGAGGAMSLPAPDIKSMGLVYDESIDI